MAETMNKGKQIFDKLIQRREIRYVAVGASTALIELLLFQFCYMVSGGRVGISNTIATICATLLNFLLNRTVTFESTKNPLRSMVLYGLLFFFNMNISSFCISRFITLGIPSPVAKVAMQAMVAVWNFFIYKRVIFV